jgi:hypothetical protein
VKRAGGMAYMIELLPSNCEALSSKPSTVKKKKKKERKKQMHKRLVVKSLLSLVSRDQGISPE